MKAPTRFSDWTSARHLSGARGKPVRLGLVGGALLLLAGSAFPARAGQTFYVGPNNGLWSNGNNWDAGTQPAAGDDAVVGGFIPGRTTDTNVTFDANYSSGALNSLTLDATGTSSSVILNQTTAGTVMNAANEYIGDTVARSIYNQSAGSNNLGNGDLSIGNNSGGSGTYNLSGAGNLGNGTGFVEIGNNAGTGNFNQTGGMVSVGNISVGAYNGGIGTFNLSNGSVSCSGGGEFVGTSGTGTFGQTGGTNSTNSLIVGYFSPTSGTTSNTYNLSAGSLTVSGESMGNYARSLGTFNQTGGTHTVGSDGLAIGAWGTFNLSGGTATVNGNITNSGSFNLSSAATLNGTLTFTNNSGGTFHTAGATTVFSSTFTNNGTFLSTGGSKQTFTSLNIGTTGLLQATAGELFTVGNNLTNNSAQNTAFDFSAAQLTLSGTGVTHRLAWPGADLGAVPSGYTNNFALGTLELTLGGSLALLDGNQTAGGGVYVHALMLDGGVAQIANIATSGGLNIYYDPNNAANGYLLGQTYPLNGGGFLEPDAVPEPGSLALAAFGLGALGWQAGISRAVSRYVGRAKRGKRTES